VTLAAFVAVAAGNSALTADATDRIARTLPLGARSVRVEATIGDLTIVGSNRSDVAIEVTRRAPSPADLDTFPALIEETPDALRVAVTQASDGRDARLRSDIVVRAPASARFQAVRLFEGRVRVSGLTGACDVDVRRGPIEASALAGRIRLESGIGSVDVRDSQLTPGGMMRLRVFNGPLRVRFARRPSDARILAVTFNGTITSDIPLTMKDKFGPRFGETTLGTGDPVMSLDVVKGDISISVAQR